MDGLWDTRSGLVRGECVSFAGTSRAPLLFKCSRILRVYSTFHGVEFKAGIDYSFDRACNAVRRIASGAMPMVRASAIHPSRKRALLFPAKGGNAIGGAVDGGLLIFDNGSFFSSVQCQVDYVASEIDISLPRARKRKLPGLRARLEKGAPIAVACIGDSISCGFNASKFTGVPPFQPPYVDLLAEGLRSFSGCEVTLDNLAVNGSGCAHALQDPERWLGVDYDLLLVAYGMNDLCTYNGAGFSDVVSRIVELSRERHPGAECIVVAGMSGNPEWRNTSGCRDVVFANALRRKFAWGNDDVLFADVNSMWRRIAARKNFYDMTGNGVNHPNDYGHRIYAAVLLAELFGADFFS